MINIHLHYFLAVARLEHLGRAAEELGVSQPALSRAIARLEEQYEMRLFERSGRNIRLNENGRIVLVHAKRIAAALDDVKRELDDARRSSRQALSLGFLSTLGGTVIPELLKGFCDIHPGAQFRLWQGPFPMLKERLLNGEIDLCLASPNFSDPALDWEPILYEALVVIVPNNHRLAGRQQIDLVELAQESFVVLNRGFGMRQNLDQLAAEAGFTPRISFEGGEISTLYGLVGAGFGVALVPTGSVHHYDLVTPIRVRVPQCRRTIGVSWRHGRYLPAMAETFRQFVLQHARDTHLTGFEAVAALSAATDSAIGATKIPGRANPASPRR